jgi:hypothetical protein
MRKLGTPVHRMGCIGQNTIKIPCLVQPLFLINGRPVITRQVSCSMVNDSTCGSAAGLKEGVTYQSVIPLQGPIPVKIRGIEQSLSAPALRVYTLYQNYPNPFNPATTIAYTLPEPAAVSMDIFNIHGEKVLLLVDAHQNTGDYKVKWNGTDDLGQFVPGGLYLCRFHTGIYNRTIRMLLLK